MPLRKGKSREVVSENIKEFHGGETYEATQKKFGKEAADRQAVAVALKTAGKSKRKPGRERPKPIVKKRPAMREMKKSFW